MTVYSLHSEPVQDSWIDDYGHLNDAYYFVAFTNATWKFQDQFNVGMDYLNRTGFGFLNVESHLRFLDQIFASTLLEIESIVLGVDDKRVHMAHLMYVEGKLKATIECLLLHFDMTEQHVTEMPKYVQSAFEDALTKDRPKWVCRNIKPLPVSQIDKK